MISPQTQKLIAQLAEQMAGMFTPPEYIPGCKVLSVADKDQYDTDNGWIDALCGRHNQQRCRWRGQLPTVAINDYVDVIYYPSYSAFVVFGQGGSGAAATGQYLLTTGTRAGATAQAQDFGANGIKTDSLTESTAAAGISLANVARIANDTGILFESAGGLTKAGLNWADANNYLEQYYYAALVLSMINDDTITVEDSGAATVLEFDPATGVLSTDGIDSVGGSGIAVADDILSAVSIQGIHDVPLVDSANASGVTSHFRDNDASYPAGWTETDAAASTVTNNLYSFWYISGSSVDTSWKYRQQTNIDIEALAANRTAAFQVGQILIRDGLYSADINYTFGIYADNSGAIDETIYSRVNLYWNSTSKLWQVRGEASDGSTASNSTYISLATIPTQPFYLRFSVQNTATKNTRQYFGFSNVAFSNTLLQSVNKTATWGQVWVQFTMSRGAGINDIIYFGYLDYIGNIS